MSETPTITLTHYDRGPIAVTSADDATFWLRRRCWYCPDEPEWGTFEDGDFDESPEQITTKWAMLKESTL